MRQYIALGLLLAMAFFFLGCKSDKIVKQKTNSSEFDNENINFIIAKNYFVNNDALPKDEKKEFVVCSQEEFDKYFGNNAFMGKEGETTKIDFFKQVCICVVLPESNILNNLIPIELKKQEDGSLFFAYRVLMGKKAEYTTRNYLIIIANKKDFNGKIQFKQVFNR